MLIHVAIKFDHENDKFWGNKKNRFWFCNRNILQQLSSNKKKLDFYQFNFLLFIVIPRFHLNKKILAGSQSIVWKKKRKKTFVNLIYCKNVANFFFFKEVSKKCIVWLLHAALFGKNHFQFFNNFRMQCKMNKYFFISKMYSLTQSL